ncbi:hypothetical protein LY76DRAFT_628232 [Colletotrichum caudatum]|nr:hypothetical protein LY76DRAFT_628232 [Colletotrichum caudatum]
MPRPANNIRSIYAEPSRSERTSVYRDRDCRAIFSEYDNSLIRQRKAITTLVRQRNLWAPGFSTERLITVLRSLQKDSIFQYSSNARTAFPELFPPQRATPPAPAPLSASMPFRPTVAPPGRPQRDLYESLETLYSTGDYSDLTISSGAKRYPVHRAIEASNGVISLLDDEPYVVDMMIQYFYRLDYQLLDSNNHSQSLEQQDDCTDLSGLFLHAKVYAIAEKYVVGGLKDLAVTKFRTAAETTWDTGDFLNAAREAYNSTIDTDRGLRDVVLEVFVQHGDLLDLDEAKSLIKGTHSLGYDLLMHLHQEGKLLY